MKKLGAFLKGVFKGGVVDSTPLSGIIEIIKKFDKTIIVSLFDFNGDKKADGKDLQEASWEQIGKAVGIALFLFAIVWAAKALGLTELF